MKLAVTTRGQTLDDPVDPRFGRCAFFVIVDDETMRAEAIQNSSSAAGGGAGIQAGQLMADHGVNVVLTGNCGPNAFQTLQAADIDVVTGATGTVREAIASYQAGELSAVRTPNVQSHFGTA